MKTKLSLLAALISITLPVFAQNAAVVNGKSIPKTKLDNLIKHSGQSDSPEIREKARNMLIDREILSQEAEKRGVIHDPDVREQLEQARLNVVVGAVFENYLRTNGVSNDELKAQYEKMIGQVSGKEYSARHILVNTEKEARDLISKIKSGEKFEDLAKAHSKDTGSGANGGDLGYSNPKNYVPEFSKALTSLEKGKMTETPVKSDFGWHIIRLDDVREAKVPTLEEMKPQLIEMMQADQGWQRQKFQTMLKQLREKARIQ